MHAVGMKEWIIYIGRYIFTFPLFLVFVLVEYLFEKLCAIWYNGPHKRLKL